MLIQRTDGRAEFPLLVAIETVPERARRRPALLTQGDAEQMLAHLAADLRSMIGGIHECRLAAPGALFDQCQLLRPGMPIYAALSGLGRSAGTNAPGLRAAGAQDGRMPHEDLQPDESIPPAVLDLLPILAEGPADRLAELAAEMEQCFLAEGRVSAHTASWLESAFGLGIAHARFMTLTDLNTMFHMQLEHFGYLPLWELIDAAVAGNSGDLALVTGNETEYFWRGGKVRVRFQTFDWWANRGAGRALAAESEALAGGYGDWLRELRRYTSTLAAHAVPVEFESPPGLQGRIDRHFMFEDVAAGESAGAVASITEHSCPDLGIVAVTASIRGKLRHYYPLTPRGLNEIHEAVTALDLTGEGMAFPGRMEIDSAARRLRPSTFDC